MLDDKRILITGGTGTIGQALIDYILREFSPKVIRIFSRDESKQFFLKKRFKEDLKNLRFFIGDVRDKDRLNRAIRNVDIVFHLAALKHVVACEYNPFETIKTNVIGLQNLIEVSMDNDIEKVVFSSSDKAATPCNTMGVTKLLGEKIITAANYYKGEANTVYYSVRFGNVLGSRGSLIPVIREQIENNEMITLTHEEMTRYILSSGDALKIMINTIKFAQGGEVFVPKMPAVKIVDLIDVLINWFKEKLGKNSQDIKLKEIGMFDGEKLYEELFSVEESTRTYENGDFYLILPHISAISNKIDLSKYPNLKKFDASTPFNSHHAPHLSKKELVEYLKEKKILKQI